MQEFLNIRLIEADESHKDVSYEISKAAYRHLITQNYGWDEERHREYHNSHWEEQRPYIIYQDDRAIGTIRLHYDDGAVELSQFCIRPEFYNRGIGTYVLQRILRKADVESLTTCLMCMKANPARVLYERHGFETVSSDDMFFHMERQPSRHSDSLSE